MRNRGMNTANNRHDGKPARPVSAPPDVAPARTTTPCSRHEDRQDGRERVKQWQDDNVAGFDAWNTYVERNGVPLASYRKF